MSKQFMGVIDLDNRGSIPDWSPSRRGKLTVRRTSFTCSGTTWPARFQHLRVERSDRNTGANRC
jgi:hypothetical protein